MTEHDHQKIFVAWVRRNYPDLVLFAIPNGGIRDAITARKLKEEGVLAGVPDLFIADGKPGLFIEMKTPAGRVTEIQNEVMGRLRKNGYPCAVCYGFEQAKVALVDYLVTRIK